MSENGVPEEIKNAANYAAQNFCRRSQKLYFKIPIKILSIGQH